MGRKIVNCPHCGKILSEDVWKEESSMSQKGVNCPQCGSQRVYKDGFRNTSSGERLQRYLCRECAYRFSRW